MSVLHAIVLGIVQGLGEFLPISSSAHLVLVPWLFKFPDPGLSFDAAIHLGTAIAVLAFFWGDFAKLSRAWASSVKARAMRDQDERMAWYLLIGSIPGGLLGMMMEEKAATAFRNPLLIAGTLTVMGIVLYAADRWGSKVKDISHVGLREALIVGAAQAIAIIPGVSRSGITMTAGLMMKFDRGDAARFSFLLSAPITFGAALYEMRNLLSAKPDVALFAGIATSAIVGYLSIKYLLQYLKNNSFGVFTLYRLALAGVILAVLFARR